MHRALGATKCWFHLKFPNSTGMKHLNKKVGHIKRKKIFVSPEKLGRLASHSCTIMFLRDAVLQFLSPRVWQWSLKWADAGGEVIVSLPYLSLSSLLLPRLPLKTSLNLPLAPANFCIKMQQDRSSFVFILFCLPELSFPSKFAFSIKKHLLNPC